jgi:hypothetical protein
MHNAMFLKDLLCRKLETIFKFNVQIHVFKWFNLSLIRSCDVKMTLVLRNPRECVSKFNVLL